MEDFKPAVADLQAANQELQESLDRCHELVARYRSKLAANLNTPNNGAPPASSDAAESGG